VNKLAAAETMVKVFLGKTGAESSLKSYPNNLPLFGMLPKVNDFSSERLA
jgi:hypothetical protein